MSTNGKYKNMLYKALLSLMAFALVQSYAQAIALVKMPLDEQLEKAEIVAVVKLVDARFAEGPRIVKLLTTEVLTPIHNSAIGEKLSLLGRNGIVGSDIGFDCLGQQAIILMAKVDPRYAPPNYYESVNNKLSVYPVRNGLVSGLVESDISLEDAIKLIRSKIDSDEDD